jgi:hypothetical protein
VVLNRNDTQPLSMLSSQHLHPDVSRNFSQGKPEKAIFESNEIISYSLAHCPSNYLTLKLGHYQSTKPVGLGFLTHELLLTLTSWLAKLV